MRDERSRMKAEGGTRNEELRVAGCELRVRGRTQKCGVGNLGGSAPDVSERDSEATTGIATVTGKIDVSEDIVAAHCDTMGSVK